jgi:NADH-quinone oxidoreductase subunit N
MLVISLVGIPPLIGFWGKFAVFASALVGGVSALSAGHLAFGWIGLATGVAGVLGSVISLGYYGKVLRVLYEQPTDDADLPSTSSDATVPVSVSGASRGSAARVVVPVAVVALLVGLIPLFQGLGAAMGLFS